MSELLRIDQLGVVVLAYGGSNQHAALLDDLQAAGVSDEHVVVVHNPDGPPHGWRPACPQSATLIAMPRNLGYASAMNCGIGALADRGHRAVLLLTHDTRIEATTVRTLLDAANAAPRYGVLGLAVRGAGGASTSYGSYMDPEGIVRHNDERPRGQYVADSMFVDGSAMFLRLDACGRAPMPERYFMYFEEAEVVPRRGRVGGAWAPLSRPSPSPCQASRIAVPPSSTSMSAMALTGRIDIAERYRRSRTVGTRCDGQCVTRRSQAGVDFAIRAPDGLATHSSCRGSWPSSTSSGAVGARLPGSWFV